jgi:hypothetical protein
MNKMILNFTPTGMVPTRNHTPHVPISPKEIINEVREAFKIGITIAHLHARDELEKPTSSLSIWKSIINGIREYLPDLVICASLSGRNFNEYSMRAAPLSLEDSLKPDMGSLTLSSLNFIQQASINAPDTIKQLALIDYSDDLPIKYTDKKQFDFSSYPTEQLLDQVIQLVDLNQLRGKLLPLMLMIKPGRDHMAQANYSDYPIKSFQPG